MRKAVILAAFVVFASLSLIVAPVLYEAVRFGDVRPSDPIRAALIFVPTVALGWLVWRRFGPLPPATQERLVRVFDKLAEKPRFALSQTVSPWDRDGVIASMRMRSPAAARRFFRPDPLEGFRALSRDAETADENGLRSAPDRWRDFGVLLVGLNDAQALVALKKAKAAGRDDFLVRIGIANIDAALDHWEDARRHARAAVDAARGDVQQLEALMSVEIACIELGDWRGAGEAGASAGLNIRRGGVAVDTMEIYAERLEETATRVLEGHGADAAKPAFNESLALRIAVADKRGTPDARRSVVAAYDRVGGLLAAAAGETEAKPYRDWARTLEAQIPLEHGHE